MITNQTWRAARAFATVRRKGAVNPAAAEAVRGFLAFYTRVSGQAGEDKGMLGMPGSAELPACWTREGMHEL